MSEGQGPQQPARTTENAEDSENTDTDENSDDDDDNEDGYEEFDDANEYNDSDFRKVVNKYIQRQRRFGANRAYDVVADIPLSRLPMPDRYLPRLVEQYRRDVNRETYRRQQMRDIYDSIHENKRLEFHENTTAATLQKAVDKYIRDEFVIVANIHAPRITDTGEASDQTITTRTKRDNDLIRKMSTNTLEINRVSEYSRWTSWKDHFLGSLLKVGCSNMYSALTTRGDGAYLDVDSDMALLGALLASTKGIAQRVVKNEANAPGASKSGVSAWRQLDKTFHRINESGRASIITELNALYARDTDDLQRVFTKFDELNDRMSQLDGDTYRYQDRVLADAYKQLVIHANRYQHTVAAWEFADDSKRTASTLREALLATYEQNPTTPPVGNVDTKRSKPPARMNKTWLGNCKRCGWPVFQGSQHRLDGTNCKRPENQFKAALQAAGKWRSGTMYDNPKDAKQKGPVVAAMGLRPVDGIIANIDNYARPNPTRIMIDTGSPITFFQRHLFDNGTFVHDEQQHQSLGSPVQSSGYGNVTLTFYDTENIPRRHTFYNARQGEYNILGNKEETDGLWAFDTKRGYVYHTNENNEVEYSLPLTYDDHHWLSTASPIAHIARSGDDTYHRRFGHTFKHDSTCPACRSWPSTMA